MSSIARIYVLSQLGLGILVFPHCTSRPSSEVKVVKSAPRPSGEFDTLSLATFNRGNPFVLPPASELVIQEADQSGFSELTKNLANTPIYEGEDQLALVACFNEDSTVMVPNKPLSQKFGYNGNAFSYHQTPTLSENRKYIFEFTPNTIEEYMQASQRNQQFPPHGCYVLEEGLNYNKDLERYKDIIKKSTKFKNQFTAEKLVSKAMKCGFKLDKVIDDGEENLAQAIAEDVGHAIDMTSVLLAMGITSGIRSLVCGIESWIKEGSPGAKAEQENQLAIKKHFTSAVEATFEEMKKDGTIQVLRGIGVLKKRLEDQLTSTEQEEMNAKNIITLTRMGHALFVPRLVRNYNKHETILAFHKTLNIDSDTIRHIANAAMDEYERSLPQRPFYKRLLNIK